VFGQTQGEAELDKALKVSRLLENVTVAQILQIMNATRMLSSVIGCSF